MTALAEKARKIRLDVLRMNGLKNRGHIGGTFSCVELLVSMYYDGHLKEGDFFYLSKGHACAAMYSILHDLGKMPKETLDTYGQDGGLGGQLNVATPGVDWNTGSIGHALGVAAGVALASKLDGTNNKAWCMIGDAELAEGSIWEALIFAGNMNLRNLICIIDKNQLSATDTVKNDVMFNNLGDWLTVGTTSSFTTRNFNRCFNFPSTLTLTPRFSNHGWASFKIWVNPFVPLGK